MCEAGLQSQGYPCIELQVDWKESSPFLYVKTKNMYKIHTRHHENFIEATARIDEYWRIEPMCFAAGFTNIQVFHYEKWWNQVAT